MCTARFIWVGGTAVQVEKELSDICSSILSLLDEHLIPTASSGESKVFYLKMKGDYHRYLAEFKTSSDRKDAAEHTLLAYKAAQVNSGICWRYMLALRHPSPVLQSHVAVNVHKRASHTLVSVAMRFTASFQHNASAGSSSQGGLNKLQLLLKPAAFSTRAGAGVPDQ